MGGGVFQQFLILTLLPILLTVLLERFFIWQLERKPKLQEWCKKQYWLEPNVISRMRYFMGFVSILFYHYIHPYLGIYWFSFWMISDITDGSVARILKKDTTIGAVIDPLSDKLLYFPPLFYMAYVVKYVDPWWIWAFFGVDFFGQFSRSFSTNKAANLFGKGKTLLTTTTLACFFIQNAYLQVLRFDLSKVLMSANLMLAFNSFFFRLIPNYWYANILSLLNLACGLLGILLWGLGYPLIYTFFLVFFGQILDLYDGRAAERWGSTPRGEIFDDLADGTNFGFSIGCIVFGVFSNLILALALSFLYITCTIYRLVRFLKDKKQANTQFGVEVFNGLPSPAGALCVGSTLLFFNEPFFKEYVYSVLALKIFVVLFVSYFMVSHIPYVHLGRTVLKKIPLIGKVFFLTLIVTFSLISIQFTTYFWFLFFVMLFGWVYIFLGRKQTKQS